MVRRARRVETRGLRVLLANFAQRQGVAQGGTLPICFLQPTWAKTSDKAHAQALCRQLFGTADAESVKTLQGRVFHGLDVEPTQEMAAISSYHRFLAHAAVAPKADKERACGRHGPALEPRRPLDPAAASARGCDGAAPKRGPPSFQVDRAGHEYRLHLNSQVVQRIVAWLSVGERHSVMRRVEQPAAAPAKAASTAGGRVVSSARI